MLTRAKLRDRIARRTGYRRDAVAHVLDVLEDVVRDELLQQGEVVFRGLFRVVPVVRMYRAHHTKAERAEVARITLAIRPLRGLRLQLNQVPLRRVTVSCAHTPTPEAPVDKYAVVTNEEESKIASLGGRPCPGCGSNQVDYRGNTPHCPRCGTEPWETKRNGEPKKEVRR